MKILEKIGQIILGLVLCFFGFILLFGSLGSVLSTNAEIAVESQDAAAENETSEGVKVPVEYQNALVKAKSYSEMMHMSKKAIYDQLISEYGEQFAVDAAQYAMEHLNADYKENALAKAKTYQQELHMSKNAIYDQLISEYGEQFTVEEAKYAIEHLDK